MTFSQVWETPLLPRQVLDKLEIKGFKVSKFVRFVKTTYSDAAMVEMGQKSNLCSVRLMIFLSTSLCRIDQIFPPRCCRQLGLVKLLRSPFTNLWKRMPDFLTSTGVGVNKEKVKQIL